MDENNFVCEHCESKPTFMSQEELDAHNASMHPDMNAQETPASDNSGSDAASGDASSM